MKNSRAQRPSCPGSSPLQESPQSDNGPKRSRQRAKPFTSKTNGNRTPCKPPPPYVNVKRKPPPKEPVAEEFNNNVQGTTQELELEWQRLAADKAQTEAELRNKIEQRDRLRKLRKEVAGQAERLRRQGNAKVTAKAAPPQDAWDTYMRRWVSKFLFSAHYSGEKTRKRRLRDALRIYHPDRFNGRVLDKVPETEREHVRKAAESLARILTGLLEKEP